MKRYVRSLIVLWGWIVCLPFVGCEVRQTPQGVEIVPTGTAEEELRDGSVKDVAELAVEQEYYVVTGGDLLNLRDELLGEKIKVKCTYHWRDQAQQVCWFKTPDEGILLGICHKVTADVPEELKVAIEKEEFADGSKLEEVGITLWGKLGEEEDVSALGVTERRSRMKSVARYELLTQ